MPPPIDPTTPPPDVTLLLERVREGDPVARDELVPLLYRELRRLA
ncbi:MAG: ECF-type sigma factor, partial [Planctomycetota bacterium JB042]